MSAKLGELLLESGLITQKQLDHALTTQKEIGGKIGHILVKLRYLKEEQMISFLGKQLSVPILKLEDLRVSKFVSTLLDTDVMQKHLVLPIRKEGDVLYLAGTDPLDMYTRDEIGFLTGLRLEYVLSAKSDIQKAINYYFKGGKCKELEEAEKACSGLEPTPSDSEKIQLPPIN